MRSIYVAIKGHQNLQQIVVEIPQGHNQQAVHQKIIPQSNFGWGRIKMEGHSQGNH